MVVGITIDGHCMLEGLIDAGARREIMTALRVKNPDFTKARQQGRSTWFYKEWLCLAVEDDRRCIHFPREALRTVTDILARRYNIEVETYDLRARHLSVGFQQPSVEMRDYQAAAINIIQRVGSGVIQAPCGSGKTNIGHGIVAAIDQPTLWLTHKLDLVEQSKQRCISLLGVSEDDIGLITRGKVRVGRKITFATVQTMAHLSDVELTELGGRFGLVLVDECHHAVSTPTAMTQFARCVSFMRAYHRIGVTATAKRADGLEKTMNWLLGPVIYSVQNEALAGQGFIVVPDILPVKTGFQYVQDDGEMLNFNALLEQLTTDGERNALVVDTTRRAASDGHVLLLTARVEHASTLRDCLSLYGAELVTGATKPAERQRIYHDVSVGRCRILVATYELAKEGLDMPVLDTLVMASPVKNQILVEQAVGRIMRPHPGKTGAVVYDLVDARTKTCVRQYRERRAVYKRLNCILKEDGK